jgi:hypothetical protein
MNDGNEVKSFQGKCYLNAFSGKNVCKEKLCASKSFPKLCEKFSKSFTISKLTSEIFRVAIFKSGEERRFANNKCSSICGYN